MAPLAVLSFDNHYARLGAPFAVAAAPAPLPAPRLAHFNEEVGALLGLDTAAAEDPRFCAWVAGHETLPGSEPVAMLYAGHQFGHYVPQLGDGRAILLGQAADPARPGATWDLHLKGAGPTPFSRGFDGRAVLRSTIREYLCGEAMHHLGIPTTRSLCLVTSDEPVLRETTETAAALVRVAPTHVRFGSFEALYYRGWHDRLRQLADYVVARWFPELAGAGDGRYAALLREVTVRTARLVAAWQAVGWAHGVLNTDNMSILGLTLDYGPYGFMDRFDPEFVPNHTDVDGRYAWARQPAIGLWNASRLAQALLPLLGDDPVAAAHAALDAYEPAYAERYAELMRAKLGLRSARPEDAALVADLLDLMARTGTDYTLLFRALAETPAQGEPRGRARLLVGDPAPFDAWAERWRARLRAEGSGDDAERAARMRRANPKYVLRNYLAQAAITRAEANGDFTELERLLTILRRPFDDQPEHDAYAVAPPEWARGIVVSCSS